MTASDECWEVAAVVTLRPYQDDCIQAIDEGWKDFSRLLAVLATGGGKTVIFSHVAKVEVDKGGKVLIIAHTDELLEQAIDKIFRSTGIVAEKEKADCHASPFATVVVASIQSLARTNRLLGFSPDHFSLVITDECFPCGTMVDGKPIESIRKGDLVQSFNHSTGLTESRRVTRLFKSIPHQMVSVFLSDGRKVFCTSGHPFFCHRENKYIPAICLNRESIVLSIINYVKTTKNTSSSSLCGVQEAVHDLFQGTESIHQKKHESVLPESLHEGLLRSVKCRIDGCNQSKILLGAHDSEQPHEESRDEGEGENIPSGYGVETNDQKRKRDRADSSSTIACLRSWLGNGVGYIKRIWFSVKKYALMLQGGCGEFGAKNSDRGGRIQPLRTLQTGAGREERKSITLVRVDRVEVQEQGCGVRFTEVCPGGFVYNIEVEGNHNYFADGILVHNCHRGLANSYLKVCRYFHFGAESLSEEWTMPEPGIPHKFHARCLGVTATADRGDKRSLGEFYQTCVFDYGLLAAVRDGWLVRPIIRNIPLKKVDMRGIKKKGGDYDADEVVARMEPFLRDIAEKLAGAMRDDLGRFNRKLVVFTPSVQTADILSKLLREYAVDADFVSGACNDREEKIAGFDKKPNGAAIACAMLLIEGWDCATVNAICVLRPTKIRSLYAQAAGRGFRPIPGAVDGLATKEERLQAIANSEKTDCLMIDFLFHCDTMDLIEAVDLVATSPAQKEAIKATGILDLETAATVGNRDLLASLKKAAEKHARREARTVDPLAMAVSLGDSALAHYVPDTKWAAEPMTPGQRNFLVGQKVDISKITCKGLASKIIDRLVTRLKYNLASPGQLSLMLQLGVDGNRANTISKSEATKVIDIILTEKKSRGAAQPQVSLPPTPCEIAEEVC